MGHKPLPAGAYQVVVLNQSVCLHSSLEEGQSAVERGRRHCSRVIVPAHRTHIYMYMTNWVTGALQRKMYTKESSTIFFKNGQAGNSVMAITSSLHHLIMTLCSCFPTKKAQGLAVFPLE